MKRDELRSAQAFTEAALALADAVKPYGQKCLTIRVNNEAGWAIAKEIAGPIDGVWKEGVLLAEIRMDMRGDTAMAQIDFFNGRISVAWEVPSTKHPEHGLLVQVPPEFIAKKIKL